MRQQRDWGSQLTCQRHLARHSIRSYSDTVCSLTMVGIGDNCLNLSCKGHLGFKAKRLVQCLS